MFDDDDDPIAIEIWSDHEKKRLLQNILAERTQNGNNFETWIKLVEHKSKKQKNVRDEKKAFHSILLLDVQNVFEEFEKSL